MVKIFCDQCGDQIPTGNAHNKWHFTYGKLKVQIIRAVDGVWNGGHACVKCLRKAVADGSIRQELPHNGVCRTCSMPHLSRVGAVPESD